MKKYLEGLNEAQKEAVETTEGYIRVIAGAGSGKTRALTCRFAYLVDTLGISPANILCVTFTNKAANEMKKRVQQHILSTGLDLICTFHGFCNKVIRRNPEKILYPQNYTILDDEDAKSILTRVYKEKNIQAKDFKKSEALKVIQSKKIKSGEYFNLIAAADDKKLLSLYNKAENTNDKIFYGFLYEQKKIHGLDFNDLIIGAMYIFKKYPDILDYWQSRLQYIMVDEFQDVSNRQYKLSELLSKKNKNLFIVGDPDQTIYSFRGANVDYIMKFDSAHIDCKTIYMEENYRSRKTILNVANNLIKNNSNRLEKKLKPVKETIGENDVVYFHEKNDSEEAETIAKVITTFHDKVNEKLKLKYNDIAILYRSNFVSRAVEEKLRSKNIPYVVYSGVSFYERKEIKDALAYLRMLDSKDNIAFERTVNTPHRNIGPKKMASISEYANKNNSTEYEALKEILESTPEILKGSKAQEYVDLIEKYTKQKNTTQVSDLLKGLMTESDYESDLKNSGEDERLENLNELISSIINLEDENQGELSLTDYLSQVTLFTNMDNDDEEKDRVKLMTIHSAKGLEFKVVIVCGMNEGIFPSSKITTSDEMEEERRLAYVAFTRAEQTLVLTESEGYSHTTNSIKYPSRFILEIDKNLIYYHKELPKELMTDAKNYIKDRDRSIYINFKIGDAVKHETFGDGKIEDIDRETGSLVVKFQKYKQPKNFSKDKADYVLILKS